MDPKAQSSLERMLAVLDLFSEEHLSWTPEDIAAQLQVSLPTTYRYVKLLVDSGLLQKDLNQKYSLGSRIITLDHLLRTGDVMLSHCEARMKDLVDRTGFDCVITRLYGNKVIDTHRQHSSSPALLRYGRGRPRPLFLGAAPKVILAHLPAYSLQKIFNEQSQSIQQANLPSDWKAFRRYFTTIRKAGYYFSNGELEPNVSAMACPIHDKEGLILGAISLVAHVDRMQMIQADKLAALLKNSAQEINENLN